MNITIQKALPPHIPGSGRQDKYLNIFKNRVLTKFPGAGSKEFAYDYFSGLESDFQKRFLYRLFSDEKVKKSLKFLNIKDENNFRFINTMFTVSHDISREFSKRLKEEQAQKLKMEIGKLYLKK